MYYKILDSKDNFMRAFSTYKQAETYRFTFGNAYWSIKITKK